MKLFTPEQKENQVKVLTEIRNGNLKHCRYHIKISAGEDFESAGGVKDYDRYCIQGAMFKVLGGSRTEAWNSVGYTFFEDERSIVAFNDSKAKSLNEVADYLVREHGWQDIK